MADRKNGSTSTEDQFTTSNYDGIVPARTVILDPPGGLVETARVDLEVRDAPLGGGTSETVRIFGSPRLMDLTDQGARRRTVKGERPYGSQVAKVTEDYLE